jgi:hypothetical protein
MKFDSARLPEEVRESLEREVRPLRSLEQIVRWAFSRTPPSAIADVIVQDEYTHDVVIPWRGVHLVFDTT